MYRTIYKTKQFFKKNSSLMLTCLGAAGVVGTAVMAVKATPKAMQFLNAAKEEKRMDLTKFEIVKTVAPLYIPSVAVGLSTIACIFGSNYLDRRRQAALTSAYMMLDSTYKEYKSKVVQVLGVEGEKEIRNDIAKEHAAGMTPSSNPDILTFYDEYSDRYFERTMVEYQDAIYHFNRHFALRGYACLNEFYELLDLDTTEMGDKLGWSFDYGCAVDGYCWVDFVLDLIETDDGMKLYIIRMPFEPSKEYMGYDC